MATATKSGKTVKVKLVKSPSRTAHGHRDTVLGLGLKKINRCVNWKTPRLCAG